jgi:cation transport regulator ChaC
MPLYFSYGSNMDARRMQARVGPFESRAWAVLENYRVEFAKRATATNVPDAAFATIAADPDARAEGVVYRVTEAQLDAMDAHEGVPEHYQRKHVVLRLTDGRRVESLTYMANPKHCAPGLKPPRFYLYHFFQASDLLSPGWMAWLRSVETADV